MRSEIDNFYLQKEEPVKSCLMALRTIILAYNKTITEAWKYRMPFFCYKGKMLCYLWIDKMTNQPYIGIVEGNKMEHPALEQGNRARMKIMYIDPEQDIPVETIVVILDMAITFYK